MTFKMCCNFNIKYSLAGVIEEMLNLGQIFKL